MPSVNEPSVCAPRKEVLSASKARLPHRAARGAPKRHAPASLCAFAEADPSSWGVFPCLVRQQNLLHGAQSRLPCRSRLPRSRPLDSSVLCAGHTMLCAGVSILGSILGSQRTPRSSPRRDAWQGTPKTPAWCCQPLFLSLPLPRWLCSFWCPRCPQKPGCPGLPWSLGTEERPSQVLKFYLLLLFKKYPLKLF